jgi:hypothetical protein
MRLCDRSTMERVIDPVIADLRREHREALGRGQVWRSRWIRIAGYVAFWKVALMTISSSTRATRDWTAADSHAVSRTIGFSLAAMAALILFQAVPALLQVWSRVGAGHTLTLLLTLTAQTIPGALVFGLPIGILCALRGRETTARVKRAVLALAIGCALTEFALMFWVVPSVNQALVALVNGHPMPPGANGLAVWELGRRVDQLNLLGRFTEERAFALGYHTRWAGPFMPLVFGLFALSVSAVTRGASRSIAIGLAAPAATLVYGVLFISLGFGASVPAFAIVWAPAIVCGAVAAALLARGSHWTREYSR